MENGIQTFLQVRSFESSAIKKEVDFILSNWNLIKQKVENNDNLVRFFNDGINQTQFKTIITHSIGLNLAQLLTIFPFARHMGTPRTYFIDDQLRLAIITNIKWPEIITEMIFDSLGIAACDKLLNRRATILANVIIENKNRIEALYKEYLEAEKNSDELALDCIRSDMTQILTPSHKSLYVEVKELVTSLKVGNKIQALIAKAFLTSAGIYTAKNIRNLGNFVEIFLNNLHATQKPGLLSAP